MSLCTDFVQRRAYVKLPFQPSIVMWQSWSWWNAVSAHAFYSPRLKFTDPLLERYCVEGENCRRRTLLEGVGGSQHTRGDFCCDVCTQGDPHPRLAILGCSTVVARKRRAVVHALDKSDLELLTSRLQQERDKIIAEHPAFRMIGSNFVLSDCAIVEICKEAKFFCSSSDLTVNYIRPEIRDRICNAIAEIVGDKPPPKRKRRV